MSGNAGFLTGFLNAKPLIFTAAVSGTSTSTITGTVNGLEANDIVVITGASNANVLSARFMTASHNSVTGVVTLSGSTTATVTFTAIMFRPEEIPLTNDVNC